jgi:hypothetical protein
MTKDEADRLMYWDLRNRMIPAGGCEDDDDKECKEAGMAIERDEWSRHQVEANEHAHDLAVLQARFENAMCDIAGLKTALTETLELSKWAKWKLENGINATLLNLTEAVTKLTVRMDEYERDLRNIGDRWRETKTELDRRRNSGREFVNTMLKFIAMGAIGVLFAIVSLGIGPWLQRLGG